MHVRTKPDKKLRMQKKVQMLYVNVCAVQCILHNVYNAFKHLTKGQNWTQNNSREKKTHKTEHDEKNARKTRTNKTTVSSENKMKKKTNEKKTTNKFMFA